MRRTDLRTAPETCDESNKSQKTFRSGAVGELFWYTTCSVSSKRLPRGTMNRAMGAVAIQMVDDTGCRPFDHRWPRTASVVDASQERYTDERASYTACAETARDDYDPG